jgi:hypothetical protein
LLRFFSLYFEDIEKLRLYLGVVSERGRESTEEYIFLFKVPPLPLYPPLFVL